MADSVDIDDDWEMDNRPPKANKKLSVERIYQKKTQLEHILLRPDTYIGSVEPVTQKMWTYDEDGMKERDVTFVPGLYKIFDEILVNAADNKQRDKNMDCIKIEINPEKNKISVWNNGQGIPVVEHKDEKMFVPSLIFGHLLTSSNYNDEERKVTGGRNGYGAKLCNIFSTKFSVETSSKAYGKHFKQTWYNNMSKADDPKIFSAKGNDFTCVTFYPDLAKFKMTELEKDIVSIMTRRAYDIAGCTRGVKVFLNDKKLNVKNFKDYIELYLKAKTDPDEEALKVVHEVVNERWEVAVALSKDGYQHVSFVNGIATTKGGRHVDYITDQLTSKIAETVKKKNKSGKNVKPFQIKTHLWVFVNCLIENPTFDSQTKENMTLQMKSFGSKCQLTEKFIASAMKCGIVESIMAWVLFKARTELEKKCSGKKHSKLKGIPKLEDANDAGTKNSIDCTLILTEGDSAKTLAVSGLGVVGRDKYGVFPLRGKLLNVREASHKQILENAEINNIIKIMGLQYKKKYETIEDLKTLRYGRLMIMTDQDQDGSHIKGLLINFIHHNWPSLLRLPFLEEFITPIVKASFKKEEKSFYSLPEFEEWKTQTPNWNKYKVKYYKGLGTSTAKEAKEYFSDMKRHRVRFHYTGAEDDNSIQLAFSKKLVDMRKEWLTNGMEERKRRRELGLPEMYLYGKDTTAITYNDFINKELILFSNMDNERSIPSAIDGMKPGQRKVIFTCLKRNDKREVKVAQLVGSVAEQSAYHHGEVSLCGTIINLAQDFVGSNNINLLLPVGQFGTRLQGGKDSASPRYIFTMLNSVTKHIFSSFDSPLLHHLYDDNLMIEPEYYVPIIPMVLVNGAEGIGTGWSTKLPNFNPRDLVANIHRLLNGEELKPMMPWYKNFRGTIERIDDQHYVISGEVAILEDNKIEITELPIRTWTQTYKENVLEPMVHGSDKVPSFIQDYKEYHTDTTVRFVVSMTSEKFQQARNQGFHKVFKLQSSLSMSSMVLFDHLGCLKKYDSVDQILKEFYEVRYELYERRKEYMVGALEAESLKLKNQARFIVEKIENKITIENKKKVDMIRTLVDRGYDSDPLKAWKEAQKVNVEEKNNDEDDDPDKETDDKSGPDYDYLLGMTLWSLTREKKDELLKKRDEKIKELNDVKSKSPADLWKNDLKEFLEELDKVEAKERDDEMGQPKLKKKATGKKKNDNDKPSPFGERVVPTIDEIAKKKAEKKPPGEGKKPRKKKSLEGKDEEDGDDDIKDVSLSDRINAGKKGKGGKGGLKQTKLTFQSVGEKKEPAAKGKKGAGKKKKNPWSDDSDEDEGSDMSDMDVDADDYIPPERNVSPRKAAAKAKYKYDSEDDEYQRLSSDDEPPQSKPLLKKEEKTNGVATPDFSDGEDSSPPPSEPQLNQSHDDLFNSLLGDKNGDGAGKNSPIRKNANSDSDSSGSFKVEAAKPAPKAAPKKRPRKSSGSSSDDDFLPKPKKEAPPKEKKTAAPKEKKAPAPKKKAAPKEGGAAKKTAKPKGKPKKKDPWASDNDGSEGSDDDGASKKAAKPKAKPKKKEPWASDEDGSGVSGNDSGASPVASRAPRGGRAKAPTKYAFSSGSDSDY